MKKLPRGGFTRIAIFPYSGVRPEGKLVGTQDAVNCSMAILEDLIVWQLADELRREVMRLAECAAVQRDFRFRDQLTSAAGSVPANIAEGYGRLRHAEFVRFLDYATGSLRETEEWLRHGEARHIWTPDDLKAARLLCRRLTPALLNLRRYLRTTPTPR